MFTTLLCLHLKRATFPRHRHISGIRQNTMHHSHFYLLYTHEQPWKLSKLASASSRSQWLTPTTEKVAQIPQILFTSGRRQRLAQMMPIISALKPMMSLPTDRPTDSSTLYHCTVTHNHHQLILQLHLPITILTYLPTIQ